MTNPSQSSSQANNPFAQTEAEAEDRFRSYRSCDPFLDIKPALLNSADIYDYIAATGLIYPFDPTKLKSASYEVKLLGECVYWDEEGNKEVKNIGQGDKFILKPNSIAFVTLEPMFRLPDYIALRFNLKITNVYRGLLLGTGPLVDPGFVGKLSLPLHNLTTNEYEFVGGEGLIWMEFTKLSSNQRWETSSGQTNPISRQATYKEFRNPPRDIQGYLIKADPSRGIRSSIPNEIRNAQIAAQKADQSAKDAVKFAQDAAQSAQDAANNANRVASEADKKLSQFQNRFAIGTVIAVAVSIAGILISSWGLVGLFQDTSAYLNATREKNIDQTQKIQSLEKEIQELNRRINQLENTAKKTAQKSVRPNASPRAKP